MNSYAIVEREGTIVVVTYDEHFQYFRASAPGHGSNGHFSAEYAIESALVIWRARKCPKHSGIYGADAMKRVSLEELIRLAEAHRAELQASVQANRQGTHEGVTTRRATPQAMRAVGRVKE